ncbi:MAG: hypothetical protein HY928_04475 [Elusimicrobia bacterium]|nr:hypothetical protein [Elusimicrobiota bacterium]
MRWLKWLSLAAGASAALLLAAALALRALFPPEKVKALALTRISAALGREVRLQSADLGLRGVRLEGVEISEVPDFKAGTALKAARLRVAVRLWPLVARREVVSDELVLQDFEASYIERAAPPAAPAPRSPAAPPAEKAAAGAVFSVRKVSIEGGKVLYRSRDGLEVLLTQTAFSAAGVGLDGPFAYSLSCYFSAKSGDAAHSGRLSAQGEFDPASGDLAKAALTLKPLSVTVDGLSAKAEGRLDGLREPKASLELSLPALTRGNTPALAALPEGFALPALTGPLKAAVGAKGLSIETLSLKGDGAALELKAAQNGTRWDVPKARLSWGPVFLSVSGTADTGTKGGPSIDLRVRLDPMSLAKAAELVPGATAYAASGTLSAELSAKGQTSDPVLAGAVTLEKASAKVSGQTLSGVEATLKLTPDTAAGTLTGTFNGSPFQAKLNGKSLRTAPDVRLDAKLDRLDLASLPAGAAPSEGSEAKKGGKPAPAGRAKGGGAGKPFKAAGTLTVGAVKHANFEASEAKLAFDLKGVGSDQARLDGSATLRIGPGRFEDLKLLASDKPILKALLLPVIILQKTASFIRVPFFPRFDTFTFTEIRGDYAVKDGVLTVRQSKLDGSSADAELTGTLDLLKDALDMKAKVRIGGQGAVKLGGTVAFKVRGTMAAPSVSVDAASILKQPAVDKAVGDVLKQGENLLKGLFK